VRKTQIVFLAAAAFVGIVCVVLATSLPSPGGDSIPTDSSSTVDSASSSPPAEASHPISDEARRPVMPPSSGLTVHPYELLKNPFNLKGHLVLLELRSRPVLYNGSVVQYSGEIEPKFGIRLGLMALKLNRMLAEDQALFDVMGVEAGNSEGEMLGQISVTLPPNITDLDLGRIWAVEPQGTIEGTNGFGAAISIPSMRFWHYQDGNEEVMQNAQPQPSQDSSSVSNSNNDKGGIVGRTLGDEEAQEPISLVKRNWHPKREHDQPSGMWWVVQLSSHDSSWDYVQVRYQDSIADPICEWTVGTWKGQGRSLYTFGQVNAAARAEFESLPADGSKALAAP
jgi:hypothetical protein